MNLFELAAVIKLDDSKFNQGVKNATKSGEGLASTIGSKLATAAKVGAAAVGVVSTAIGVMTKKSLDAYADYEQLVGGVETLFDSSADKVLEYANRAYKTAGLSANAYMETVTSFSASLLQSLAGDTEKATKYADMAVTDMSDNANKMGTDMSAIQWAYQGFAKQNYTMLDNLKLGYGGTKQEMERLLADASKLSGQRFDISSYADVVEAIHVVQEEMGITGTTAKEAASTIQGSVGSMKAAWENFLTGLGDKEADLGGLADKLVDSTMTVADNIVPVVSRILKSFSDTISTKAPEVVSTFASFVSENTEPLVNAAVQLILALVDGLSKNAATLARGAVNVIKMLVDGLVKALPQIMEAAIEIVTTLADALANDPDTLVETAITLIDTLVTGLFNAIPKLIQAAGKLIAGLVRGLVSNGPKILKTGLKLVGELYKGLWEAQKSMWKAGANLIEQLWEGIKSAWEDLKKWFKNAWDSLFGGLSGDVEINGEIKENGKSTGKRTVQGSFAKGLDYVPYDGYIAELHRGETVLTAKESARYRSGGSGNTDELLTAILNKLDGMGVYLDGTTLTGYVDSGLGKRTKQANRLKMA